MTKVTYVAASEASQIAGQSDDPGFAGAVAGLRQTCCGAREDVAISMIAEPGSTTCPHACAAQ